MPAQCDTCNHGLGGVPPASCSECGGVYGSPPKGRCAYCNRRVVAIAPECENWLSQNEPPAEPPPGVPQ